MNSIYGYYNGKNFVPENHINLPKNQKVIITILEEQLIKSPLEKYIGKLDDESAKEMLEALEECRQIYDDESVLTI